jgi:hypothetical protein
MREQPDFTERFQKAVTHGGAHGNIDRIERRLCTSDNFDGAEYKFYGYFVPVRPLIQSVRELDDFAIESMGHNNEGDEPYFHFFLADLRQTRDDPAFTQRETI